jgi:hypothetical protein
VEATACGTAPAPAGPAALTEASRQGGGVSTVPEAQRERAELVAGFLCAFSFTLSGLALVRTPGLLAPVAILLALVAARMTVRHSTLAAVAVAVSALAFFFGMLISISTDTPIY